VARRGEAPGGEAKLGIPLRGNRDSVANRKGISGFEKGTLAKKGNA